MPRIPRAGCQQVWAKAWLLERGILRMKKITPMTFLVSLVIILVFIALQASADDAEIPLVLPDLVSFSNGIGSVYQTDHKNGTEYETYYYQCRADQVEPVVQEYIRELRKFGIFIRNSEKIVYDSETNDANYGIVLRDTKTSRTKFQMNDSSHNWTFKNVSIFIMFSTGGQYASQFVTIYYAKNSYEIADTGARMRSDRSFSPADYYFYRNQLTEAQQTAYDYILSKVETMKTPISLNKLPMHMDYDEFFLVWYSVLVDNPQLFMVAGDQDIGEFKYFRDGAVRSFSVYYCVDKSDLPALKEVYEDAITEALKVIDPYMTDYQKELALHDWLCRHTRYDYQIRQISQRSYSGIVDGLAICEGYSESFTELMHRAGIETATVYGWVLPEEQFDNNSHAWNIVCIDGRWYYTDVTWDDTKPIRYKYFNVTTSQISADHVNGIGTFPMCYSREAAYRG